MQTTTSQREIPAAAATTTTTSATRRGSSSRGSFEQEATNSSEPPIEQTRSATPQLTSLTLEEQAKVATGETEVSEPKDTPNEVMEILRTNQTLENRLLITATTAPKIYPNNTLLVDLSKCHRNITNFWPQTTQAALVDTFKGCWRWRQRRRDRPVSAKSTQKKPKLTFQMPESILRTNIMLTLDDYDKALSVLTNDIRYQLHLLLYRRIHTIWVLLTTVLCSILPVLLTNLESLVIIGASCLWLLLQILGTFVTAQFRHKLDQMLEKSVAQVNTFFMDHNLMLGVINTGSFLSKSKLIIPMLYFDTSQCREQIESIISTDSRKDADGNSDNNSTTLTILDYSKIGLPLKKPNIMAFAQSQLAKKTVLRYSQRWISYFDKQKLMFTDDKIRPRHLSTGKCLCQFIEEHLRNPQNSTLNAELLQEQKDLFVNSNTYQHVTVTKPFTPNGIKTAILIPNGKQYPQHQHLEKPPEIGKQIINKTTAIPTLSGLFSLKDSNHLNIDIPSKINHMQALEQPHQANGFANGSPWRQLMLNVDHLSFGQSSEYSKTNLSQASTNQTPKSVSPEVSLEMGSDLISRSDELVRKLRLLLEIKKDELQGIDGSLFSGVLYRAPQPPIQTESSDTLKSGGESSPTILDGIDTNSIVIDNEVSAGKRFYTQREGLFFLGSGGAKKSQQQDTNRNHVLEIC